MVFGMDTTKDSPRGVLTIVVVNSGTSTVMLTIDSLEAVKVIFCCPYDANEISAKSSASTLVFI